MRHSRWLVAAMLAAPVLPAQQVENFGIEARPFIGAFVPVGHQRQDFRTATMIGGQGAFEFNEFFHLVGTVSWTYGHVKFSSVPTDVTHIWQYDLGGEFGAFQMLSNDWLFRPFVGAGGGGRTYDYRAATLAVKSCTAGYGSLGMEFQRTAIGLRFEGRGYANCFESPLTSRQQTRYDLAMLVGLAYHFR